MPAPRAGRGPDDKRVRALYHVAMSIHTPTKALPVWSLSWAVPKPGGQRTSAGFLGLARQKREQMGRARLVFINTCGFIAPAVRESVRAVLDA